MIVAKSGNTEERKKKKSGKKMTKTLPRLRPLTHPRAVRPSCLETPRSVGPFRHVELHLPLCAVYGNGVAG